MKSSSSTWVEIGVAGLSSAEQLKDMYHLLCISLEEELGLSIPKLLLQLLVLFLLHYFFFVSVFSNLDN